MSARSERSGALREDHEAKASAQTSRYISRFGSRPAGRPQLPGQTLLLKTAWLAFTNGDNHSILTVGIFFGPMFKRFAAYALRKFDNLLRFQVVDRKAEKLTSGKRVDRRENDSDRSVRPVNRTQLSNASFASFKRSQLASPSKMPATAQQK